MSHGQVGTWNDVRALWALVYEVDPEVETTYLDWFHGQHIPEKLARPGYLTAAHYRMVGPAPVSGHGFVALFGAADTRVFLDPSPGQLKSRQDETTRRMIGHREGALGVVLSEEWRAAGHQPEAGNASLGAPVIALSLFDTGGADDAIGAWYAQDYLPVFARSPGCVRVRKLLSSIGGPRHGLFAGYASLAAAEQLAAALPKRPPKLAPAAGFPVYGERVWPAPAAATA